MFFLVFSFLKKVEIIVKDRNYRKRPTPQLSTNLDIDPGPGRLKIILESLKIRNGAKK